MAIARETRYLDILGIKDIFVERFREIEEEEKEKLELKISLEFKPSDVTYNDKSLVILTDIHILMTFVLDSVLVENSFFHTRV